MWVRVIAATHRHVGSVATRWAARCRRGERGGLHARRAVRDGELVQIRGHGRRELPRPCGNVVPLELLRQRAARRLGPDRSRVGRLALRPLGRRPDDGASIGRLRDGEVLKTPLERCQLVEDRLLRGGPLAGCGVTGFERALPTHDVRRRDVAHRPAHRIGEATCSANCRRHRSAASTLRGARRPESARR